VTRLGATPRQPPLLPPTAPNSPKKATIFVGPLRSCLAPLRKRPFPGSTVRQRHNIDVHRAFQNCAGTNGQQSTEKGLTKSHSRPAFLVAPQPHAPHLSLSRLEGYPVVRPPEQLHLHAALAQLDVVDSVGELNEATRLKDQGILEPILITTTGTVLTGIGRWQLTILEGNREIACVEYPLAEAEALQFILAHYRRRQGWNDFVRIRIALVLETSFQEKALDNQRAGGKCKGLANLPEAHHIDVREQIARAAGVGARNVAKVRTILQSAHPTLIEALRDGTLSINRAFTWCGLRRLEQLGQLTRHRLEIATNKVIRQAVSRPKENKTCLDPVTVLQTLQMQEERQPGSVVVRAGRLPHTVILMGRDLISDPESQE
jgi:hypothetical protein